MIIDLANHKAGIKDNSKSKISIFDWLDKFYEIQTNKNRKNLCLIKNLKLRLEEMKIGNMRLCDIDKEFCLKFMDYIKNRYKTDKGTNLKRNSQYGYFSCFNASLNKAVQMEYLDFNPFTRLEISEKVSIKTERRTFLTVSELKLLESHIEVSKFDSTPLIFLFGCYSGLRISDIQNLKWENVFLNDEHPRLEITIQKTKTVFTLPLSKNALKYLPKNEGKKQTDYVFEQINTTTYNNRLQAWAGKIGLGKHISSHIARHTFATLLLAMDASIYVIKELLGHKKLETTLIYTDVIDTKKSQTIGLLDKL